MTIQTQGSSGHFVYQWDDTVNGSQQRAVALQASCESDLARLEDLFDEHNGFDGNRVTVIAGNPGAGLASNTGYRSDGTTRITITAWSGVNPAATADAGDQLEFVAEICEILMDLRNKRKGSNSWNPGGSNGEGLSQYLAERFYFSAYYDLQLAHGPARITSWLNDPTRPDWVTRTESTDNNFTSFGCAFLFLHFLHTQKGFSVHDIITKGGATLEDTYKSLTGHSGGWSEFSALVSLFYPTKDLKDAPITYTPSRCNLFPLFDDNRRSVSLSADEIAGRPTTSPGDSLVNVSPGLLCPKKEYSWHWVDSGSHLECSARAQGFGNPVVVWVIDGTDVPAVDGTVTVTGSVDLDRANQPDSPLRSTQSFRFFTSVQAFSDLSGPGSRLILSPVEHPGTEQLTIEVRITERYAPGIPALGGVTWRALHTHNVRYQSQYYADRAACKAKWNDFLKHHVRVKDIDVLLTLPDPGPEELGRAARVIQALQLELRRLHEIEPEAASLLGAEIARVLQVSPTTLHVPARGADTSGEAYS